MLHLYVAASSWLVARRAAIVDRGEEFRTREEGQTTAEYALVILAASLIAFAALAVAALAYSIWLQTPRGSVWDEIAITAGLLSVSFALRATVD